MYQIYFGVENCFSEMVNFAAFFEQQFYPTETVKSVSVLGFADAVAGVGDGVDNGPDAVAVVAGWDCLSTERIWGFGRIRTS